MDYSHALMFRSGWGSPLTASLGNSAAFVTGRDTAAWAQRAFHDAPEQLVTYPELRPELFGVNPNPEARSGGAGLLPDWFSFDSIKYVLNFLMYVGVGLVLLWFGLQVLVSSEIVESVS